MTPTTPGFAHLPATKQDVADMGEAVGKTLDTVKSELKSDIDKLGGEVKKGFENLERLLTAPNTGLIPRVKRVEEKVGIQPGT